MKPETWNPMWQCDWIGGSDSRAVDRGLPVDRSRARRTDPSTSKSAAKAVKDSGRLGAQQREVLALVRRLPGHTAVELAHVAKPDDWRAYRYTVSRRLPELAAGGFVRRGKPRLCTVSQRPQTTWRPVEGGV